MKLERREVWVEKDSGPKPVGCKEWASYCVLQHLLGFGPIWNRELEISGMVLEGRLTVQEAQIELHKADKVQYPTT